MAVALGSSSESHTGTTGSTSEASFSWTHGAITAPKGILVFTFTNANADDATAVSYGGTSLAAVSGGRAVDTAGEPGDCKAWFLGSSVPFTAGSPSIDSWVSFTGPSTDAMRGLAYANGTWVAGNAVGEIYCTTTPLDGASWTAASSPGFGGGVIKDIAYGNGYFVAVGDGGVIRYATDPTGTWSAASSPGFTTTNVNKVAYDGTYWVAVADSGKIRYATDPTGTWSAPTSTNSPTANLFGLAYGNGYWVAAGDSGVTRYATDPTGTWTAPSTPPAGTCRAMAYGNGYFVSVGDGGGIYYATDPTGTWTAATAGGSTGAFWGAHYGNGYWVAATRGGVVRYKATDPTGTWTTPTASASISGAEGIGKPVYANGIWLMTGRSFATPGGVATVTVTRNNNANEMYAVAISVNADYNVETTGVVLLEGDNTLAEQNVNDGSPGTSSLRFAGINSGLSGIVTNAATPGANNLSSGASSTWAQSIDYGTRVAGVVYETTAGQGGRNVGFSATTSDDRAAVHLAIREAIVPWTVGVPIR